MTSSRSNVRVRFAPSPTGALHVGGARTALFNFLFARHHGGTFIIRIEDTDRERSTEASEREIFSSLDWLGMRSDEPVQRQTERMDRYARVASELLANGGAYRCYCSAEALQSARDEAVRQGGGYRYPGTCREVTREPAPGESFVVRLKAPRGATIRVRDLVRGEVEFSSDAVDDWILVRTDGTPTYNFTVVVDDADMGITHVIRGEDHLSNTPKQILCYQAMGLELPEFAHVSMILGADRTRLSKRHGATAVGAFRSEGFLASAMLNYLARLGWAHGDQELFGLDEMIEKFDISAVTPSPAIFDTEKLRWVNAQHMKLLGGEELRRELVELARLVEGGADSAAAARLEAEPARACLALESLKTRSQTLRELLESARFYFEPEVELEPGLREKLEAEETREALEEVTAFLATQEDFGSGPLEEALRAWCDRRGLKLGKVAQPMRFALTGRKASPPIFEVAEILGKGRTLERLRAALGSREPS